MKRSSWFCDLHGPTLQVTNIDLIACRYQRLVLVMGLLINVSIIWLHYCFKCSLIQPGTVMHYLVQSPSKLREYNLDNNLGSYQLIT